MLTKLGKMLPVSKDRQKAPSDKQVIKSSDKKNIAEYYNIGVIQQYDLIKNIAKYVRNIQDVLGKISQVIISDGNKNKLRNVFFEKEDGEPIQFISPRNQCNRLGNNHSRGKIGFSPSRGRCKKK